MPSVWMCEHGVYEMLRDVRRMRGNRRTSCACVMEWRLRAYLSTSAHCAERFCDSSCAALLQLLIVVVN